MSNNFALAVKSTIDKHLYDISSTNSWGFFDLDGAYMDSQQMESKEAAISWSFLHLLEDPKDPLYRFEFEAGPKTSDDLSQYLSLEIVSVLQNVFKRGASIYVMDYSGSTTPTEILGCITITASASVPAQFDNVSGFRMLHVQAAVSRAP